MAPAPIASSRAMIRTLRLVVAAQEVVDLGLDGPDLVRRHRPGLAEVEAQPVGRDQRALLRHVLAQMPAQRGVQQVGGRVGAADAVAAGGVDLELDRVADRERPALERPTWTNRSPSRFCVSVTCTTALPQRMVPVSPIWPPDSP